eukprot:1193118-Prorocentrum_minimum.AAC.2
MSPSSHRVDIASTLHIEVGQVDNKPHSPGIRYQVSGNRTRCSGTRDRPILRFRLQSTRDKVRRCTYHRVLRREAPRPFRQSHRTRHPTVNKDCTRIIKTLTFTSIKLNSTAITTFSVVQADTIGRPCYMNGDIEAHPPAKSRHASMQ